jgi:hypothetical protein
MNEKWGNKTIPLIKKKKIQWEGTMKRNKGVKTNGKILEDIWMIHNMHGGMLFSWNSSLFMIMKVDSSMRTHLT